jgi:parallel beta-helix repeat protein
MSTLYRAAFAVACAWLLVAVVAGAAFAQAEPFSLTAAVKAGAPFTLPPGNYGDLTLRTSADITCQPGAVFNTVNAIPPAHDVTFHDCRADMAFAQGKTIDSTPVVRALSVANFHWFGGAITGPVVPPGGTGSGLVEGMPAGVGVAVQNSSGVVISGADISRVRRGITLNGGSDLTLTNNEIHDLRGSPIDGSVAGRITIANNKLHDVYPWNWGAGDHADFIHLWPDAKADCADRLGDDHRQPPRPGCGGSDPRHPPGWGSCRLHEPEDRRQPDPARQRPGDQRVQRPER